MTDLPNVTVDGLKASLKFGQRTIGVNIEEQPGLAYQAGEYAANCKAEAKRASVRAKEIEAQVEQEARGDPEKFGLAKTTESAIASVVTLDERVRKAKQMLIAAEKESDVAYALVEGYHHRKGMIEAEVRLMVADLWGEVDERTAAKQGADAAVSKAKATERKLIAERLKKRKVANGQAEEES